MKTSPVSILDYVHRRIKVGQNGGSIYSPVYYIKRWVATDECYQMRNEHNRRECKMSYAKLTEAINDGYITLLED